MRLAGFAANFILRCAAQRRLLRGPVPPSRLANPDSSDLVTLCS
jgi:hypothetical protein